MIFVRLPKSWELELNSFILYEIAQLLPLSNWKLLHEVTSYVPTKHFFVGTFPLFSNSYHFKVRENFNSHMSTKQALCSSQVSNFSNNIACPCYKFEIQT